MAIKDSNILVTGGAGYIGAHTIVELIQSGYNPVIIDNFSRSNQSLLQGLEKIVGQSPVFVEGDCLDKNFLRKVFVEYNILSVIHFAAFKSVGESVENPILYYRNNIDSLISLLEIMREFDVKDLIFSSSCTVYGQPDMVPVTEDSPFKKAQSPYGATKQICERILEDCSIEGFRIISLRYFNPIGAHPSGLIGELPIGTPNNLVPFITQTAIGKRDKLIVFGNDYDTKDGSCVRDFIHVVDLSIAHMKAMEYMRGQSGNTFYQVFNVGTGIGISVLELIQRFEESTGVKLNYVIGARRPGDVEKTYADPSKTNKVLGWQTKFSLEEALLHAWNWEKKLNQTI